MIWYTDAYGIFLGGVCDLEVSEEFLSVAQDVLTVMFWRLLVSIAGRSGVDTVIAAVMPINVTKAPLPDPDDPLIVYGVIMCNMAYCQH